MKTFKTYLPIFPGFYRTHFDCNDIVDRELYHLKEHGSPSEYDKYEWDFDDYKERIAKQCVDSIEHELKDLLPEINIQYECIISPRYYNYGDDSINCIISLSQSDIGKLYNYLNNEIEWYKDFIKGRYTSCDGFISHYSNSLDYWLPDTLEGFNSLLGSNSHALGTILEFYLQNEDYEAFDLYESTSDEWYINYTLLETT